MSATIVSLTDRRNAGQNAALQDRVTQAVMQFFCRHPVRAVVPAIESAHNAIASGGSFQDAMDAAGKTVQRLAPLYSNEPETRRNAERLVSFYHRRERRVAAYMELIEPQLRARMAGSTETEIITALGRAYHVLAGGGSMCLAMYRAIGDDPCGGAA